MDSIDFGRAVKAPFEDKDWIVKTLLGFVWTLLVVTAPAVTGAQIVYIRSVSEGREQLPEWSDFGDLWVKGALAWVAGFIYFLPVIVLSVLFLVPVAVTSVSEGDSGVFASLLTGGACIWVMLVTLYAIAVSVLYYAALTHFSMKGTFGAFFQFGEILAHVRGPGYFTAWLFSIVVSVVGGTITSVISGATGGFGGIVSPAITYLMLMITGHLFGQWASRAYGPGTAAALPATAGYPPVSPPAPPAYTPPAPPAYTPPVPPAPEPYSPPASEPAMPPAPQAPQAPPVAPQPPSEDVPQ